jgi:hypothetical protein
MASLGCALEAETYLDVPTCAPNALSCMPKDMTTDETRDTHAQGCPTLVQQRKTDRQVSNTERRNASFHQLTDAIMEIDYSVAAKNTSRQFTRMIVQIITSH